MAGATVYITGRSREGGATTDGLPGTIDSTARLVTEAGGKGIAVACDHTIIEDVERLAAEIQSRHGPIYIWDVTSRRVRTRKIRWPMSVA